MVKMVLCVPHSPFRTPVRSGLFDLAFTCVAIKGFYCIYKFCSLNNHAVKADMPTVSISGQELDRVHNLRHLGITFDRSLSGKDHITRIVTKARKGLNALKLMAIRRMPERILFILYQTLVLSVIDYGFGMLTLSASQL